jgi:hypothetical protein
MVLRRRATATALTLAAAAIAVAPSATADAIEDYFLNELYKTHQKWFWPFGEQYIIGVAHSVCDDWAADMSYPDEVDSLAVAKDWTHRNTRWFIALSTVSFCPDRYETKIPADARLVPGTHPGASGP